MKTHCKNGHDTTLPESRYASGGCKACRAVRNATLYSTSEGRAKAAARNANHYATPEGKAYHATYYATYYSIPENKAERKAYDVAYRSTPEAKDKVKYRRLKKLGWTPELYATALAEQEGLCAICKKLPTGKGTYGGSSVLAADHDHTTNKPRALLCHHCNKGLGIFRDNPELLYAAGNYIREWTT